MTHKKTCVLCINFFFDFNGKEKYLIENCKVQMENKMH